MASLSTARMTSDFETPQSINRFKQPKGKIQTNATAASPLNVAGLALGFSRDEIVQVVRESRLRYFD